MVLLSNWKIAGVTGLGTERLLHGIIGTETVTGYYPGGCRLLCDKAAVLGDTIKGHTALMPGGLSRGGINTIV
jgi:hypothetical protein